MHSNDPWLRSFMRKAIITVGAFGALFVEWKGVEHTTFHETHQHAKVETLHSGNHLHLERMDIPEEGVNIFFPGSTIQPIQQAGKKLIQPFL